RMHAIPTLFFRKYSHSLDNKMKVVDTNRNLISLKILRGHNTGYIVEGFDKLVQLYRLKNGGSIKLRYLFNDIFYVLKIESFHYASYKVNKKRKRGQSGQGQMKTNYPYREHARSMDAKTAINNLTIKPPPAPAILEFEKSHPVSKPLDIDLNVVPDTDKEDTTIQEQCIVKINHQDVEITKEQPMVPLYKFPPTYPTSQLLNGTSHVFSFVRFNNPCIIPFFPSKWSDNAPYYSFMSILTNQEVRCSYMVTYVNINAIYTMQQLIPYKFITFYEHNFCYFVMHTIPTNFAIHAFPSRFNDVHVILSSRLQYHMRLNWNIAYGFVEVIMDRGWRAFVRNHFLRAGTSSAASILPLKRHSNMVFRGSFSTQPSVSPTDPTIQSYSLNPSELHVIGLKDVARKKNKSVAQPDCLRSPLANISNVYQRNQYAHESSNGGIRIIDPCSSIIQCMQDFRHTSGMNCTPSTSQDNLVNNQMQWPLLHNERNKVVAHGQGRMQHRSAIEQSQHPYAVQASFLTVDSTKNTNGFIEDDEVIDAFDDAAMDSNYVEYCYTDEQQ
ncbi:hypothetical protein S245_045020, partial [Arachis hypogaea]